MSLDDICSIMQGAGIACRKWSIPDPEEVPLPHAAVCKICTGDGTFYADDGVLYAMARCQIYLAMYNDEDEAATELAADRALRSNGIQYSYKMGYDSAEAVIIKIYTIEIREDL